MLKGTGAFDSSLAVPYLWVDTDTRLAQEHKNSFWSDRLKAMGKIWKDPLVSRSDLLGNPDEAYRPFICNTTSWVGFRPPPPPPPPAPPEIEESAKEQEKEESSEEEAEDEPEGLSGEQQEFVSRWEEVAPLEESQHSVITKIASEVQRHILKEEDGGIKEEIETASDGIANNKLVKNELDYLMKYISPLLRSTSFTRRLSLTHSSFSL